MFRQLGYDWGVPTISSCFGSVPATSYSMDALGCAGTEAALQDCSYSTESGDLNW